jgi:hypothetical protein
MAKDSALPLILGGAALAAIILGGRRGGGGSGYVCPPTNCNDVSSSGGVIAGIRYREFRSYGLGVNDPAPMIIRYHGYGSQSGTLTSSGKSWAGSRSGMPVRVIVPESPRVTSVNQYFTWWKLPAATSKQSELTSQMATAAREMRDFLCGIQECRQPSESPSWSAIAREDPWSI